VTPGSYPRVASFKTAAAFRAHLHAAGISLDFDDVLAEPGVSPLARSIEADGLRAGNRFCILPMEGWDGTTAGEPTELTRRRWRRFGESGAKLIWGGEAVAVRHDGRANPNQLLLSPNTVGSIAALREDLVAAHRARFGSNADADLVVGLQLTHSGRFARPEPDHRPSPLVVSRHALLDARFPDGVRMLTDRDLDVLVDDFSAAARLARNAGFDFVDIKHCHGYLAHELLGSRAREGRYGGTLEGRTAFLRNVIGRIRADVPDLRVAVRLSVLDTVPFRQNDEGVGVPAPADARDSFGFGVLDDDEGIEQALSEGLSVIRMLEQTGVRWICTTAGSPYYNPHVQRPALFPPIDGYLPPEDPLRGVARQLRATAILKASFPGVAFVGSAYSYLQEWLPHVAQHQVRAGFTDLVGLGRVALSYPDLPSDVLSGRPLRRQSFCRTFSDCTTAPRMGLQSGCYPLDSFYSARPEALEIRKKRA
jgi:2,4-dienoyl-CoA reductase-like NADH-dependent reductase (Old Yellow Enzyme family)